MFETILVAIDGSDHSEKATHLAADIAKAYEADLVLLYVCPEGPLPIIPGMVATVEVMTGQKSVLDYLLKPVLRISDTALRER